MKDKDKKTKPKMEQKVEQKADEQQVVDEQPQSADDKVEETEKGELGLDRENLTDEQYIEKLEEKFGQCMAESMMCRNLTQRLQADFDNYRKRTNSYGEEMKLLGQSTVIEKMLSVLDNCDLARKYIQDEAALTGFNMMETQILNALDGFGLKSIVAEGAEFDAKCMSAVEREKSEGNENKVIAVLAKGYTLNGKLLRPASVKIGY